MMKLKAVDGGGGVYLKKQRKCTVRMKGNIIWNQTGYLLITYLICYHYTNLLELSSEIVTG
jgi:hypothetical protein